MKTGQVWVAAVVALAAIGGCSQQGDEAQRFGAKAELTKLTLGFGGGPPAMNEKKETPLPEGQKPIDRAGRSILGGTTSTPSTTTSEIGPRAHGELTGAAPKNPITQRQ